MRNLWLLLLLLLALPLLCRANAARAKLMRKCEAQCTAERGRVVGCELRAALLLPNDTRYDTAMAKVMPVIDLAVDRARSLGLLPYWLNLTFQARDDRCDATYAQLEAMNSYAECVHVFFGPTCDYCVASVGRVTKFLDAPLITTGGFTFDFTAKKMDDDDEYFMVIRAGTLAFRDIAMFIIGLMDRYNWKKIHLLYDTNGQCQVAGRHTCQLMMKSMVEFVKRRQDLNYGNVAVEPSSDEDYAQVLKEHVGTAYSESQFEATQGRVMSAFSAQGGGKIKD